ncbi:MAG: potassium-transporting ATPase subunit KdpC [Blastocatellia bacterium]|nr:potassium-transporting ATPase subunit KdpC [Blastocatellia bacterium]
MKLKDHVRTACLMTLVLIVLLCGVYPLVVTGLAHFLFREQAHGSLIMKNGTVIGSRLIGQPFTGPGYFHSRPSAAGAVGYDGTASGGTNLGPTSAKLIQENVKSAAVRLRQENPGQPIPVDLVTASASGLDPHISPAAAAFQISRIAKERKATEDQIRALVAAQTEGRTFGILGEARVNVLELNLALDERFPRK